MSEQRVENYRGKIRRHQFPPLRKAWMLMESQPQCGAEYQQQRVAGFQQGISDGFEQGMIQGKEQGYQDGLSQGREQGIIEGSEQGSHAVYQDFRLATKPIEVLLKQLRDAVEQHEQRRRSELLQLVEKVTRQVIRCELALHPTQLLVLVEEVLSSLPEVPKQVRVLLSPEEFIRIRKIEPEKVTEWGLVADANLASGECRIVTESADMDVGCDHRLAQCMEVLTQGLSTGTDSSTHD